MSIIFRYVNVRRQDETLKHAPFITVLVRGEENKNLEIVALLDSGADSTVIPKDLADVLGLKEEEETETGGIGGNVKVKKTKLQLTVVGNREKYSLTIPALILQETNSDMPLLLRRNGFFDFFHITFKQNEEKIILKKIQPKKEYY
jgi:predicted aspartyl protease